MTNLLDHFGAAMNANNNIFAINNIVKNTANRLTVT